MATIADFDWETILEGVDWLHWSGINPALSDNLADICVEACSIAKSKGITISCDLNYSMMCSVLSPLSPPLRT